MMLWKYSECADEQFIRRDDGYGFQRRNLHGRPGRRAAGANAGVLTVRSGIAVRIMLLVGVLAVLRCVWRFLILPMFALMRVKPRHANHGAEQRHDANEDGHSA